MSQAAQGILSQLESLADPEAAAGMERYGIKPGKVHGISISTLRKIAGDIGVDHTLEDTSKKQSIGPYARSANAAAA